MAHRVIILDGDGNEVGYYYPPHDGTGGEEGGNRMAEEHPTVGVISFPEAKKIKRMEKKADKIAAPLPAEYKAKLDELFAHHE